jgi:nicotinamide-nucleotide amidase
VSHANDGAGTGDSAGARLYPLSERLGRSLQARGLVLVTAESCTAGGVAYAVTQIPGSSAWFDRGVVVYSNEAKQRLLAVPAAYLRDFGAVSEPVARAMATGALQQGVGHAAIAVTGIAGPGGGSAEKPVGTVCFAWALRRETQAAPWVLTATRHFEGDRAAVRTQSIFEALDGMNLMLQRQDAP